MHFDSNKIRIAIKKNSEKNQQEKFKIYLKNLIIMLPLLQELQIIYTILYTI